MNQEQTIKNTLEAIIQKNGIAEIRVIDALTGFKHNTETLSGYFNDLEKAAKAIQSSLHHETHERPQTSPPPAVTRDR